MMIRQAARSLSARTGARLQPNLFLNTGTTSTTITPLLYRCVSTTTTAANKTGSVLTGVPDSPEKQALEKKHIELDRQLGSHHFKVVSKPHTMHANPEVIFDKDGNKVEEGKASTALDYNVSPAGKCYLEWKGYENPVWTDEEVHGVRVTHKPPEDFADRVALAGVRALRTVFDYVAGFKTSPVSEEKYLIRCIVLETVAGIPGMVAGSIRHLSSLRRMKRDHGWIATLLEEAENERMHLLTFLKLKRPGPLLRMNVLLAQGAMWNLFFITYLINPKICHRFVGYVEEEAVHTYTMILDDIDSGKLPLFTDLKAPQIAVNYWKLKPNANFRELILAIRADEANHRLVNHTFADVHAHAGAEGINPFMLYDKKLTTEQLPAAEKTADVAKEYGPGVPKAAA